MHSIKNINIRGKLEFDRPLANLTTFSVGGPADILAWPDNGNDITELIGWATANKVPWMVIGGGANILVSDLGIRGLVIATGHMNSIRCENETVTAGSGSAISDVSAFAADKNLGGLEFIYSMPGTTGGAVWMNARCYGGEISEVLTEVEYIDLSDATKPVHRVLTPKPGDFHYKISPFQGFPSIILNSSYKMHKADSATLWEQMKGYEADRRSKGHFDSPCAGSVFKNNRDFGAPSGKLLDSISMRGVRIGGAQVSHMHANIIVNNNNARASEISELMDLMQQRAYSELGFMLEPEVIKVGQWS